ncbi:MAG: B12-binding domain-containing radical SAM protein [Flavobacteriaceae bacterium]|nr:B12-binding domain-containing radical SAM protein [Eudoraea sp.]NNL16879.1 B12-binding domain-containing radical SAM protein [Flavobacteriaceae bacterium]
MKVLLIAPTALDNKGNPITQGRLYLPGLTLPMLAAVTPSYVKLKLVYETVDKIPFNESWDLVGLTGMGSGIYRAWQIGDIFRSKGVKVVLGGIGASLLGQEECLKHCDSIVLGEAEDIWPHVINDARQGQLKQFYSSPFPPDINNLPVPRLDLLEKNKLGLWRPVQVARGCPHSCNFCSVSTYYNRSYRKQPIENVIRDVRAAKKTGSKFIAFIDDNIGVDFNYSKKLWEALISEKIIWISQCSLHITERPDMLKLAYESGCRLLSFGIETTSETSLSNIGKTFNNPERYSESIALIKSHGIDVSTEMMIGLDGDDSSVYQKTFDFIMNNHISTPRIHIFTPIPGTPVYQELENEKRIVHKNFNLYSGGNVVFKPKKLSIADLQLNYWKLYKELFKLKSIWRRIKKNEASLGPIMRGFVIGVNFHYRNHIKKGICPGIV